MNLRPYIPSGIAFGLALACIAGAVQQFVAAQSPGAVVPLAIGGVPGSAVGLGLLAVVGLAVGLWLLPRREKPREWYIDPDEVCLEWCGLLAQHMARNGQKRGLELVTALSVYLTHGEVTEKVTPVKGAKS